MKPKDKLQCPHCSVFFTTKFNHARHVYRCPARKGSPAIFPCNHCGAKFTRKDNLKAHTKNLHEDISKRGSQPTVFHCGICDVWFLNEREMKDHRKTHKQPSEDDLFGFSLQQKAHKGKCAVYRQFFTNIVFAHTALRFISDKLTRFLIHQQGSRKQFKFNLVFLVEYVKLSDDGKNIERTLIVPFRSDTKIIKPFANIRQMVQDDIAQIANTTEEFCDRGSGWTENEVLYLDVEIANHAPISGSCVVHSASYQRGVGLSLTPFAEHDYLKDKHCFYYAIAQHFVQDHNLEKLNEFIEKEIKVTADTPVKLEDIENFEEENSHLNFAVNVVFKDEEKDVYPVHISKNPLAKNIIVLLLAHTGKKSKNNEILPEMHYSYLKEPEKMLAIRKKSDSGKTRTLPSFFCWNCFNFQYRKDSYEQHVSWCHKQTSQKVVLPERGDTLSFNPRLKMAKLGYMLFFDFETLQVEPKKACACPNFTKEELEDIITERMLREQSGQRTPKMKECTHKTKTLQEYIAFSYCLVMTDRTGEIVEEMTYTGEDADVHFVNTLLDWEKKYTDFINEGGRPLKFTKEEKIAAYNSSDKCGICGEVISEKKVLHHDHISGNFICVAHNHCNLKVIEEKKFVALAHNFSGFDSHIIVNALGKGFYVDEKLKRKATTEDVIEYSQFPIPQEEKEEEDKEEVVCEEKKRKRGIARLSAIPLNTEKFKVIQINSITLMDSAAFLPDSLDKLVQILVTSNHDFPYMKKKWNNPKTEALLKRKGCYPYGFATSLHKLKTTTELPPITDFHNIMGDVECSQEDYHHARKVWDHFNCKNMIDYTEIYVTSDTFLLCEIMTNMRNQVFKDFELDVCQYWSLPMLSKDAMLKFTGIHIDLIHDQEMINMLKTNIRGGLSFVNTRFATNNPTDSEENRSLLYVDKNNLYGSAQSMVLPLRDFKWLTKDEIANFNVKKQVTDQEGEGYILDVTLKYPSHLHNDHHSFPLAPHVKVFEGEHLSEYARHCLDELKPSGKHKGNYKAKKLTSTFEDRERYVCHGINLKLYLELGLELIEIHRGISFYQKPFLRPFIEFCTKKRAASKTKSESDLFKLYCNALYGKSIESIDKRMDCHFNRTDQRAMKSFSDPLYKGVKICGENLSISFHRKKEVKLNQSWAIGFSILELSKFIMQSLYYKCIRPALNNKCSVLMSDTDSFLILTSCKDSNEVVEKMSPIMDFSNYPINHSLHNITRKNQLGFIKNEVPSSEITAFVGLKAKTYAFKTKDSSSADEEMHSRAKGVKKIYKKTIPFESYLDCIQKVCQKSVKQITMQSKNHLNMLTESNRVAFNSFDDKRYLLCAIHSTPYGSMYMKKMKETNKCYFCEHPDILI